MCATPTDSFAPSSNTTLSRHSFKYFPTLLLLFGYHLPISFCLFTFKFLHQKLFNEAIISVAGRLSGSSSRSSANLEVSGWRLELGALLNPIQSKYKLKYFWDNANCHFLSANFKLTSAVHYLYMLMYICIYASNLSTF